MGASLQVVVVLLLPTRELSVLAWSSVVTGLTASMLQVLATSSFNSSVPERHGEKIEHSKSGVVASGNSTFTMRSRRSWDQMIWACRNEILAQSHILTTR